MLFVVSCSGLKYRCLAFPLVFSTVLGINAVSTTIIQSAMNAPKLVRRDAAVPASSVSTAMQVNTKSHAAGHASLAAAPLAVARGTRANASASLNISKQTKLNLTLLACKQKTPGMDFVILTESVDCVTRKVIESLNMHADPRRVLLVAPAKTCGNLNTTALAKNVVCVREDSVVPEVSYNATTQWLATKFGHNVTNMRLGMGGHHLGGWYLQQFLKMGVAEGASQLNLSDHYVVWDSDMVLLRDFCAFNEHHQANLMESEANNTNVCNKGYQNTFEALTGLPYMYANVSKKGFTAHHMVINRQAMIDFLNTVRAKSGFSQHWSRTILETACLDLVNCSCGFSEYGSYASWMSHSRPQEIALVPMQYERHPLQYDRRLLRRGCCPEKHQSIMEYHRRQGRLFIGFERSCNADLQSVSIKSLPR